MTVREFESYYRKLYMPLGMYALRMSGDVDESEDIVQECFATVWQRMEAGCDIGNFKSYMYRAVRNGVLMRARGRVEIVALDNIGEVAPEDIDTSERDAALWRAVDALPERCREIFLMSKRDGLSNAAIASELDLSVKTVENQMTKALRALRAALDRHPSPRCPVFFLPFL